MHQTFLGISVLLPVVISAVFAGPLQVKNDWGTIDWSKRHLVVTAQSKSVREARITVSHHALEIIQDLPITSSTTVERGMMSGQVSRSSVEQFVNRRIQTQKTKKLSSGSRELVLELPLDGKVAEQVLVSFIADTPAILKTFAGAKKKPKFTGLIVDCSGLGIKPALVPSIVDDDRQTIYGPAFISRQWSVQWGAAAYASTLEEAKKLTGRIGSKPLIIKGAMAVGAYACDAMIAKKDALRITKNPANYRILAECRVILVVD